MKGVVMTVKSIGYQYLVDQFNLTVCELFVQSNGGVLSKAKREKFNELTDAEIAALESVIQQGIRCLAHGDMG